MATAGPNRPSAFANDTSIGNSPGGTVVQTTTSLSDSDISTETTQSGNGTTALVQCTGYGFAIPVGATINSVSLKVRARRTGPAGSIPAVRMVDGGTTLAPEYGPIANGTLTTSLADYTFDVTAATSWTVAKINAAGFGAGFTAQAMAPGRGLVSDITITVDYTEAAASVSKYASHIMGL